MQPATTPAGRLRNYVRAPGEESYERLSLDALRFEDGAIAEVITFPASVLDDFGLPERF